jgi:hypothetical protein
MFSHDDLSKLIRANPSIAVSIFLPTQMAGRETQQNAIAMKNLFAQARGALDTYGVPKAQADEMLAPAAKLITDFDFWQHQEHGLAVFLSENGMQTFKLPISVAERVVVGQGFHIAPLLGLQDQNAPFIVLTATADDIHVYQANRFEMTPIQIDDLPQAMTDMTQTPNDYEAGLQSGGYGRPNTGGKNMPKTQVFGDAPPEWRKGRQEEYARHIAAAVGAYMADKPQKVVVIADAALGGCITNADALSAHIAGFAELNPASQTAASLHAAAAAQMQPIHAQILEETLQRFDAMLGRKDGAACTQTAAVIAAAQAGQIEVLFVAQGAALLQELEAETGGTPPKVGAPARMHDLVDMAAQMALRHGGSVKVVSPDRLPQGNVMAAILRY